MALKDYYFAFVTLGMSDKKASTWRQRVTTIGGQAYIGALTQVLKDGTAVGLLMLSVETLSKGVLIKKGVTLETVDDAADYPLPNDEAYAFDKFGASYSAAFDNYQNTIPARKMDEVFIESDGIHIAITGGSATTAVTDFVSRFNAVALGKNDGAAVIDEMFVVS